MVETMLNQRELGKNLRTFLAVATGRPIGLGKAPDTADPENPDSAPWGVLHKIPGGGYSGSMFDSPEADVEVVYQVRSVGFDEYQAEWMADRVRRAMIGRDAAGKLTAGLVDPALTRIIDRRADGGPGGADPEGSLFSIPERFIIYLTSA